MRKYTMGLAGILGLMVVLALSTARAADTGRVPAAEAPPALTTEASEAAPDLTTTDDEPGFGGCHGQGQDSHGQDQPSSVDTAENGCGYYDTVGVWNRTDVTVVYWIRHPADNNNQWMSVTLPPNGWYYRWVRGATYGQYFQIAYDWDLCSAGNQFTYLYPVYNTAYLCSAPGANNAYWYHITRRNACVIGM